MMCKHLRTHGIPKANGAEYTCMDCGHTWFKERKPFTPEEQADYERFKRNEEHQKFLREKYKL